ncbi:hypothetical protein HHI36_002219 [Cryptolaemus montrouzieri]|uniref:Uncharacterized protein n=1 Tax=Cryptolaemus montrouzieri TaxID=559131 RepID=A0ABD2PAB1_9CUCU
MIYSSINEYDINIYILSLPSKTTLNENRNISRDFSELSIASSNPTTFSDKTRSDYYDDILSKIKGYDDLLDVPTIRVSFGQIDNLAPYIATFSLSYENACVQYYSIKEIVEVSNLDDVSDGLTNGSDNPLCNYSTSKMKLDQTMSWIVLYLTKIRLLRYE